MGLRSRESTLPGPAVLMKVLHLENDVRDAELVAHQVQQRWPHAEITVVAGRERFAAELQRAPVDVILADNGLPGFDGASALELASASAPETPFILVSGTIGEETAVAALRAGASDYVLKDRPQRLTSAIENASRRCRSSARARHGRRTQSSGRRRTSRPAR